MLWWLVWLRSCRICGSSSSPKYQRIFCRSIGQRYFYWRPTVHNTYRCQFCCSATTINRSSIIAQCCRCTDDTDWPSLKKLIDSTYHTCKSRRGAWTDSSPYNSEGNNLQDNSHGINSSWHLVVKHHERKKCQGTSLNYIQTRIYVWSLVCWLKILSYKYSESCLAFFSNHRPRYSRRSGNAQHLPTLPVVMCGTVDKLWSFVFYKTGWGWTRWDLRQ